MVVCRRILASVPIALQYHYFHVENVICICDISWLQKKYIESTMGYSTFWKDGSWPQTSQATMQFVNLAEILSNVSSPLKYCMSPEGKAIYDLSVT